MSPNAVGDEPKPARRSRSTKPFPLLPIADALLLAKTIHEHGVGGQMRRLTLLDKIGKSPNSSATRTLIIASSKYGLTTGSYSASQLALTDDGTTMAGPDSSEKIQTSFDLSVGRFDSFRTLYEKLKDKRLPDDTVLRDELGQAGIPEVDRKRAANVFVANLRHLDLVKPVSGTDCVRSIDEILDQFAPSDGPQESPTAAAEPQGTASQVHPPITSGEPTSPTTTPSLHIDVQIHIDASASVQQIDQIFMSMAKHLYGRDE